MNNELTQKPSASKGLFIERAKDKSIAGYFNYLEVGYQIFRHDRLISTLKRYLSKNKLKIFLDIGCANGHFTNKVYNYFNFKKAIGIDFVPSLVKDAKAKYKHINFFQATLPKLKFKKNKFDLVIASEVLYYLKPTAQHVAIKRIKEIMKKDSYLLISSPNEKDYLTLDKIRNLFKDDFKIIFIDELKMKYYHIIVNPFFFAIRINQLLKYKNKPFTKKSRQRYNKIYRFISKFPFRQLIIFLSLFSKMIIKNRILPKIINYISYFSMTTNTIILAKVIK